MKVIVKENLGADYVGSIISSCNQNGIQAIADYTGNEILFYDPKNWLYGRHSDMMKDASLDGDIFEMFNGKNPEFKNQVMKPTKGPDFERFAVEWNALQRQEDPDIIKTKNCSMIRVKGDNGVSESRKPKECKKIGKSKKDDGLSQDDLDFLDKLKNTDDEFGRRVNGIEAQISESEDDNLWDIEEFLDDQEILKPRDREFVKSALRLRWGIEDVIDIDDPDWDEAWDDVHSELMLMYGNGHWHESGNNGFKPIDSAYLDDDDPDFQLDDDIGWDNDPDNYEYQDRMERMARKARKMGKRVCWMCDKMFKPNGDEDLCPDCAEKQKVSEGVGNFIEVELGDRDFDQLNEYLGDMAQSYWEEDNMGGGGKAEMLTNLYSDVLQWLNDRGFTRHNHSPITLVVDGAQIPARDLAKEILDGVYKENEDSYTGYGENTYNMNESGSNGGVIDVTLKFTNGHYGKKLKAGDERTIKLDTSTAPTIYDKDDLLTWIAEVASDQVPGGGCFTKYSFETIDPPDDVLIKAVMGDEGFGPDVDVDFEDFEPEDVPSEISYKDALNFYKKMHDAYDDRKLDYNKYDQIRKRLMNAIVKGLLKEKSLDELADEWFINYGTMNGWGWKTSFKYNVACALHDIHKKKHPDEHVVDREDTMRGWHSEKCSCGLASSCDSSD